MNNEIKKETAIQKERQSEKSLAELICEKLSQLVQEYRIIRH